MVTSRSLFARSTSTPAYSDSSRIGNDCDAATSPTKNAFRVSSNASQPSAIDCIHVPMSDSVWPDQKSRKLRWRRARNGLRLGGIAQDNLPDGTTRHSRIATQRDFQRATAYALER